METSLRTMVHEERSTNDPDAIMLGRSAQGLANLVNGYELPPYSKSIQPLLEDKRISLY